MKQSHIVLSVLGAAVGAVVTVVLTALVTPATEVNRDFAFHIYNPKNLLLPEEKYWARQTGASGQMTQNASPEELDREQRATPKHFVIDEISQDRSTLGIHFKSISGVYGDGSFRGDDSFYPGVYIGMLRAWAHEGNDQCHFMTYWAVVGAPNAERLFSHILSGAISSGTVHLATPVTEDNSPIRPRHSCSQVREAAVNSLNGR